MADSSVLTDANGLYMIIDGEDLSQISYIFYDFVILSVEISRECDLIMYECVTVKL